MDSGPVPGDVLAAIAGIQPGSRLALLRDARPDVTQAADATWRALFEPEDDDGLPEIEREALAVLVAERSRAPRVAAFHRERLARHGNEGGRLLRALENPAAPGLSDRERALFRHAVLLTERPAAASEADIRALEQAGIGAPAIVTLAQLVAYLSFEIRTIAVLRAIGEGTNG